MQLSVNSSSKYYNLNEILLYISVTNLVAISTQFSYLLSIHKSVSCCKHMSLAHENLIIILIIKSD